MLAQSVAQDLIAKGRLRADDLARSLVPALLSKCDKLGRGCKMRTGGSNFSMDGVAQLGFLLGGALSNREVQQKFGISRLAVVECRPPLVSTFLPRFFLPTPEILKENVRCVLSLLHDDHYPDRSPYMLIRDEVVYSRSFNILYGMCHLITYIKPFFS